MMMKLMPFFPLCFSSLYHIIYTCHLSSIHFIQFIFLRQTLELDLKVSQTALLS
jgi:hypothetical protein